MVFFLLWAVKNNCRMMRVRDFFKRQMTAVVYPMDTECAFLLFVGL